MNIINAIDNAAARVTVASYNHDMVVRNLVKPDATLKFHNDSLIVVKRDGRKVYVPLFGRTLKAVVADYVRWFATPV
jgi:hypothetical protein